MVHDMKFTLFAFYKIKMMSTQNVRNIFRKSLMIPPSTPRSCHCLMQTTPTLPLPLLKLNSFFTNKIFMKSVKQYFHICSWFGEKKNSNHVVKYIWRRKLYQLSKWVRLFFFWNLDINYIYSRWVLMQIRSSDFLIFSQFRK